MRNAGENDQPIDDIDALQLTEGDEGNYGDNDMQEQQQQNVDMINEHDEKLAEPLDDSGSDVSFIDAVQGVYVPVEKINFWSTWINNAKREKSAFMKHVKNYEKWWKTVKNDEFKKFTIYLEKRWMHFNGNINSYYKSDFLSISKKWNDELWIKWIKDNGQRHLDKQFKKWMDYNIYTLYFWIRNEWRKWLLTRECELDKNVWNEQEKNRKINCWFNNVNKMEKKITNTIREDMENWKREMTPKFNQWKKDFTYIWIDDKQWNVWLKELEQKNEINVDAVHS
ncbi:tryptophan-rich antigen, putative [Plasmodium malariae]|uniref:Tryptophan-rich antigen, putative n=1 Tax=Plasmodium malariae TaxID=5858 RepID=A0A1A8WMV8_PLAMA|nr:tryptophan-rich antigen, putative [Plasmodium malariae]